MEGATGWTEGVRELAPRVLAFTTGRAEGSFGLGSRETVDDVIDRWSQLQDRLAALGVERLAAAQQVHGATVASHAAGWSGWLRMRGVDGHFTTVPGTAAAVTIADCTPVFLAHPRGAVAALHAGWRGTADRIVDVGLDLFEHAGFPARECVAHLGPAICGRCYEVGPEVLTALHGIPAQEKGLADVRAVLVGQLAARGVHDVSVTSSCTRCHNDRFFSHRAGDRGRQLGVITLLP